MRQQDLAQELRERQYRQQRVARGLIDALTDEQIIDAYITCSHCGEKQVTEDQLQKAIAVATNSDNFFQICNQLGSHHKVH